MNDNFAENLAKPCQKADQPPRVTDRAMTTKQSLQQPHDPQITQIFTDEKPNQRP